MASIFDRYSSRQYQTKTLGQHVPKYAKPFKENHIRSKNSSNYETKTTRPMSLKKPIGCDPAPLRLRLRLLVFVENPNGSRSSIFDSERNKAPKLSRSAPSATQPASKLDNEMRMVFGSFPMKISNNTAIKVHSLKSSNKAMISNVFTYYDNTRLDTCFCVHGDDEKSETASPVSVSLTSNTIPIKKPSLVSSSIQSCSFNSNVASNSQLHSLSSSMPSGMLYGSYASMYKRLMRSVSNSLISDSTTVQNTSIVESNEELNFEFNAVNNFETKNDPERRSLSAYSNNGSVCMHQSLCEKCIENKQYPKYKIGVAILYSLPNESRKRQTSLSTSVCINQADLLSPDPCSPKNSPQSPTVSSPLTYSNSINIDQSKTKKSYDNHINLFASTETPSSSTSSSPNIGTPPNINLTSLLRDNENFYEYLFSHLPLIEHQFKHLIERIASNLPSYFSSIKSTKRISIVKNSSQTRAPSQLCASQTSSFIQRVLTEFDEYERKFNLLYSSPRLASPAWLTLVKKKSTPHENKEQKSSCCLSNTLLNDFVHLSNFYQKPTSTDSILINKIDLIKNLTKKPKPNDKERSFFKIFLSTLLKYHLSWVYTVLPSNELAKDSSCLRKQQANWTQLLEKTNPYNPLWAQLSDLHGAVNQPLRLVRCVVLGKNRELVEKILFICSYFIRCGNSSYFDIQPENFDFNNLRNNEAPIRINLREMSETKFDPIAHLSNVLNSSAISSSSGSRSASIGSVSASPFGNNLSPVYKNDSNSTTNAHELPLIGCKLKQNLTRSTRMQDNFGYSLLASYCDEFVFEFVLHGTSDHSFLDTLHQKLVFSKFNSILDCPISESLYIVIDADQFDVKIYSSETSKPVLVDKPIGLVDSLIQSVLNMSNLFQNSEFVLLHLEDKLQELYTKSETMNQVKSQSKEVSDEKLMKLIEINDETDLDFLKQIQSAITIHSMF